MVLCVSCGREVPPDSQFCNGCGANLGALMDAPVAETPTPSEETAEETVIWSSGSFIGRRRELGELTAALEDTISGRGGLVMLAGEPGIGKTRTAQELASRAETLGAQVLWGRCFEEEGTPPYWPWLQLLRSYIQQQTPEQLQVEMGSGAANIAEIAPELGEKLPNLETLSSLEPEQARFRLFDSITTFLKKAAQSQPMILVLDDLHWADNSSLLLLEFLAREIQSTPLLVLGTYRDMEVSRRHPLSETLGSLIREQPFLRVQLSGLAEPEVEQLIQRAAAFSLPPGLSATIHQRTEGNPLFVTEIIRMLPDAGIEEGQDYIASIPEGVRNAIGRRLNRLSEDCNQILTTASVIGREFDFKLQKALSGDIAEEGLLALVDEAIEGHIIEELPQTVGRYQFTHALIQETLTAELTLTRRVRLHGRIAEALEDLYGTAAGAHAAELAHHFAQAESVLGPEKLVRYSLLAGEQALASHGYEDALAHFERGLVARDITLSGTEAASDEEAAALLFGLARAQSATGTGHQLVEAFATLSRAFEYYSETGSVVLAVAAAEFPISPPPYQITGVAELIARALTLVPDDSHEAGRLLSRYGGILGIAEGDYDGAQHALGRAIVIARRQGDVALEVETLTYSAAVNGQHLHLKESVDNGLRAIKLATGNENLWSEQACRRWTAISLLRLGDPDGARPHALALLELAERRSTPNFLVGRCLSLNSYLSCLKGDWSSGREYNDRCLEISPLEPGYLIARVLLEHETGESAQGEVYLERLLVVMGRPGPNQLTASANVSAAIPAIFRITGIPDRLEIAHEAAETILSETFSFSRPSLTSQANAGLALLAVERNDQSAAEGHYAYFLERRGTIVTITGSSVDHLLGLLSQTMGNLEQAVPHFEDSLTFCRKAGYRPELAWTCCDYSDALLQRAGPGDRQKAMSLLEEALAISTELGMRPLMERVVAHQERAESQPVAAPAYPDGLTQREVEVLRLVATGKTDRGIAEELFLSTRTVTTHVSNILNKTNAANRAEAAAYASRNGLA